MADAKTFLEWLRLSDLVAFLDGLFAPEFDAGFKEAVVRDIVGLMRGNYPRSFRTVDGVDEVFLRMPGIANPANVHRWPDGVIPEGDLAQAGLTMLEEMEVGIQRVCGECASSTSSTAAAVPAASAAPATGSSTSSMQTTTATATSHPSSSQPPTSTDEQPEAIDVMGPMSMIHMLNELSLDDE